MSGPIIRKYGFPNFDKIFGTREVQHGAPEKVEQPASDEPSPPLIEPTTTGSPPGADATEAEKQSEDSAQL